MGMPAARLGDSHACPAFNGPVPHVGGVISTGAPTVLIGKLPAARMGDVTICVGPPGTVLAGSPTVLIVGQPAARLTDSASHGGAITGPGCPMVLIG